MSSATAEAKNAAATSESESRLQAAVRYLASDQLEGRGVGTHGIDLAAGDGHERLRRPAPVLGRKLVIRGSQLVDHLLQRLLGGVDLTERKHLGFCVADRVDAWVRTVAEHRGDVLAGLPDRHSRRTRTRARASARCERHTHEQRCYRGQDRATAARSRGRALESVVAGYPLGRGKRPTRWLAGGLITAHVRCWPPAEAGAQAPIECVRVS